MTAETAIDSDGEVPERLRTALGLTPSTPHYFFYRHRWPVRVCHWINAIALAVLLMSGLNIFNAHPALYFGNHSDFDHPALSMTATTDADGTILKGFTWIGGKAVDTTGLFGASRVDGQKTARGFPDWATLPGPNWLAMARQWHFAFAWILVFNAFGFYVYGVASRHFRRDLVPTTQDIANLPHEIAAHARLEFPHGEAARRYNGLQKLAYCAVIFVFGPLIVASGLTMSPTMDAAFPFLLWIFGGRQTARTIHFLCAFSFLAFFLVHIAMVMLSGTWNNVRSMLTGWYVIRGEKQKTNGGPHG